MKTKKTRKKKSNRVVKHAKKVIKVTPKFIHGMFVGAFVGLIVVMSFRASSSAKALSVTGTGSGSAVRACVATGNGAGFHINSAGSIIAVYFHINGAADCTPTPVTLVSWTTPNITGQPLSGQKLYTHATGTFGYKSVWQSLDVNLPKCSTYQIDLVAGSSYLGTNGTDTYGTSKLAGMLGGSTCPSPAPAVNPTTPTPVSILPAATTTTPASLPNTGPGAVLIIGGLAVVGGYVFHMTHRHLKQKRHPVTHRTSRSR